MITNPSFADAGIQFSTEEEVILSVSPQLGFDFSQIPDGTQITESNGVRSLDPYNIFDIYSFISGVPLEVNNGKLGSDTDTMGLVFSGTAVSPTGAYFRIGVQAVGQDFDMTATFSIPEEAGFSCKLNCQTSGLSTLSIDRVAGDGVTLEKNLASVNISYPQNTAVNELIFKWDGTRFSASYLDQTIAATDSEYILYNEYAGGILSLILNGNVVSRMDAGAYDGVNLPDLAGDPVIPLSNNKLYPLSGPERGLSFVNFDINDDNFNLVGNSGLSLNEEYSDFVSVTKSINAGSMITLNSVPSYAGIPGAFPGDVSTGTNIRVGISSPFTDEITEIEDLGTKNFGVRTHIIEVDNPATPLFTEDDFEDIAAIATADLNDTRIPYFIFLYSDWQGGATPQFESDFNFIIDELHSVGGPCWVTIAPRPDVLVGIYGTMDEWLDIQNFFKTLLNEANSQATPQALNIAFFVSLGLSTAFAGSSTVIDAISSNEMEVWDGLTLAVDGYSSLSLLEPYLNNPIAWASNRGFKINLGFNNDTLVSEATLIQANEDLYEFCLNSNARIISLTYDNYNSDLAGGVLSGWVDIMDRSESINSDSGSRSRTSRKKFPRPNVWQGLSNVLLPRLIADSVFKISPWGNLNELIRYGEANQFELYEDFYAYFSQRFMAFSGVQVYGPDIEVAPRGNGFDASYNGSLFDSRDVDMIESFISKVEAATPEYTADGIMIRFRGDCSSTDMINFVEYLKTLTTLPILVRANTVDKAAALELLAELESVDGMIIPSNSFFSANNLVQYENNFWEFSASLSIPSPGAADAVIVNTFSETILGNGQLTITNNDDYDETFNIPPSGQKILLGNLVPGAYDVLITGDVLSSGSATFRLAFNSDNTDEKVISDTKFFEV